MVRLLVVGLGNVPLPHTRHSVGHVAIDALAARFSIPVAGAAHGFTGRARVRLGDSAVDMTLFKPKPPMNITGPAVAAALRHTAKSPTEMVVIHDSLQHKPKTLSVKLGGSANGHNGVRSVIAALGGDANFYRLRIGIGRDGDAASYVLGRLSAGECAFWEAGGGLDIICKELANVVSSRQH